MRTKRCRRFTAKWDLSVVSDKMFGYLDIERDKLQKGQQGLWQTFMCGLCFSTKKAFGNVPRMFISNDVNFFNVLFHSVLDADVGIENGRCFSHPIKKRALLKTNDLTDKLAVANVLLTYWNLYDDVVDDNSRKKKAALSLFKKPYAKAKKQFEELDNVLDVRYNELRKYEQSDCASVDIVSHSFAQLSQEFCNLILGDNSSEYAQTLCYNVGKWIYLIDALDDVEKDIKRNSYNVFVKCYNVSKVKELETHFDEIQFLMYSVLNRIAQSFNDLNLTKYTCILQNVIYDSIRNKTKQILNKIKV